MYLVLVIIIQINFSGRRSDFSFLIIMYKK